MAATKEDSLFSSAVAASSPLPRPPKRTEEAHRHSAQMWHPGRAQGEPGSTETGLWARASATMGRRESLRMPRGAIMGP
jgi:hypothetical protein